LKENSLTTTEDTTDMVRVYVAGPYSGPDVITILDNMRRGLRVSHQVLKHGFAPFAPWLDYLFSLIGETTLEEYYAYSIAWLKVSDCVLLVPGWETSKGTKKELEIASELGLPVFESIDELLEWDLSRTLCEDSECSFSLRD